MRKTLAYSRAPVPSPVILLDRCAAPMYAKQIVVVLSTIPKVAMVNPSPEGELPEQVALCITFALAVDIF